MSKDATVSKTRKVIELEIDGSNALILDPYAPADVSFLMETLLEMHQGGTTPVRYKVYDMPEEEFKKLEEWEP